MSLVKQGYWIRVQGGKVTQVWDTQPPVETESGWKEAIEIHPDLVPNREYVTHHTIDHNKTPAEIIWHKTELTVDDRKGGLIGAAKGEFQRVVNEETQKQLGDNPAEVYDPAAVEAAKVAMEAKIVAVNAATTHEDLDALSA
jgi:hypothetical protein